MKKIFAIILGITLFLLVFAGCAGTKDVTTGEKPDDSTPESIDPEDVMIVKADKDYEALYAPVIKRYISFIGDVLMGTDFYNEMSDDELGIMEAANGIGDNALNEIGYIITDISGDDVPELLVGISDKNEYAYTKNDILAVYTLVDDKPFFLIGGRSRSSYSLTEGNTFFHHGSSGAAYSAFGEIALSENGTELVYKDFYFTDVDEDYNPLLYHNKTGNWDSAESTLLDIDEDAFWEKEKVLAESTIEIDFAPLSSYTDASVKAEFADEKDYEDCEVFIADESGYQMGIVFTAKKSVRNFKFIGLSFENSDNENGYEFREEVLYTKDKLEKGESLIVEMTFFGDVPSYGISYIEEDGSEKRFAIGMSGLDGSLVLSDM